MGNEKQNHVALKIETMSTRSDAAIVAIAAVKFDINRRHLNKNVFYELVSWKEQHAHRDRDTLEWWKARSKSVKMQLRGKQEIEIALEKFAEWCPARPFVWVNGMRLDIPAMEHAHDIAGMATPWEYYNLRDIRTLAALHEAKRAGTQCKVGGQYDAALDGAIDYAKQVITMWGKAL